VEVEFEPEGDDGEQAGDVELPETTRAMLERAIELTWRDVHELMTPRSAVLALPATTTAAEAARAFADSGYSRIPLFGESRDDIVGILYAKDLFSRMLTAGDDRTGAIHPRKLVRPPMYVPESKNAAELLAEFQTRRVQMAIVLDEYGGVAGLITLEDLLEELVGEIVDEHDVPSPEEPIKKLGESLYEVDATLPIEELNDSLNLRLPTDEDYSTVGGLAFSTLGHLPAPGATFRRGGVEFSILRVEGRSIRRLRVDLDPSAAVNSPSP
jgi:CBS domain containing-hemolysin-like protein